MVWTFNICPTQLYFGWDSICAVASRLSSINDLGLFVYATFIDNIDVTEPLLEMVTMNARVIRIESHEAPR
jgi:hypothetical protein